MWRNKGNNSSTSEENSLLQSMISSCLFIRGLQSSWEVHINLRKSVWQKYHILMSTSWCNNILWVHLASCTFRSIGSSYLLELYWAQGELCTVRHLFWHFYFFSSLSLSYLHQLYTCFPKWNGDIFQPHTCFWFPLTIGLKYVYPCIKCDHCFIHV